MAGLAQPSTYSMDATAPPSIISMDAAAPPSTSIVAAPAPSTSPKAAPAPPSNSPTAGPAQPSNSPTAGPAQPSNSATVGPAQPSNSPMAGPAQPSNSPMPAPTPPSNSTMAVAGEAHKKRPGYELPRSGCKKKKKNQKIAAVQEEHAKRASPRVYSPKIVASSPGVNMLARSAALKRASSAVRHASAKRAKSADQLETPASQRTPLQNTPSLENLSPAARRTSYHGSKRRRRKLVSRIWEEAEPIYDSDEMLVEGRCIHCQQIFPATRDTGTSHIRRHLKVCPMKTAMNEMVDKLGPPDGVDPNWKFDPKVSRFELVKLIVVNELPFSLAEYKPFRDFAASLNPWFKMPCRTTVKDDCIANFKRLSLNMQQYCEKSTSRVSLTADMWTSNQKLGYLCVTCHLIDSDWKLQKFVIRFFMMETPHNAMNMYSVILKTIQDFNLEYKLFGFTLDNAPVNTAMIKHLRKNLLQKDCLLLKGKMLHCRCAPHVFNLMVQDALLVMKSVVNNIRESVQFVKSSQSRRQKFQEIINQVGCCFSKQPSIDVQSRWNSTYLMLESAMPFRTAFDALGQQEKDYEFCPTPNEWKMAEAACKLLKVFYTATKLLSGSNYPTSHLYFPQLCKIKKILKRESSSKNNTIAHMVQQMEIKLEKYWKESFKSICVPVVFDPRFKFDLLEYMLKDFGSETEANIWMHKSKRAIQKLFDEYSREIPVNHQQEDCGSPRAEEDEEDDDPLAEWDHYITCKKGQATNELDQYLKEELYPRKKELDILEWWKINSPKYPVLSTIARDILAISASTVPSESAFSSGGRIVSDYRSSLSCSTIEALICLQDWLRAADPQKYKGASLGPEEEE